MRELEGAIIKLLAYSSLTRREITIDLAREALGGVLKAPDPIQELSPQITRDRVAQQWGVTADALASKRRTKEVTVPRQIAMYLIRELLDLPLVDIGKVFGGRDHSTVIHSIRKVEEVMASDPALRQRIEGIRAELAG